MYYRRDFGVKKTPRLEILLVGGEYNSRKPSRDWQTLAYDNY